MCMCICNMHISILHMCYLCVLGICSRCTCMFKVFFTSYCKHFKKNENFVKLLLFKFHCQMAGVEKMKPLEVELKRLEDLAEDIVNDFAYMRQREQEMRDTNGV